MIGGPVENQEQRLRDHAEEAPVDYLLQLGTHLAQQVRVLGPDEQRKCVESFAAHAHADAFLVLALRIGNRVGISGLFHRRLVARQKDRSEIAVFNSYKGELAASRYRAVLRISKRYGLE